MLKVKHLNLFKPKKLKKGGNFYKKTNRARFFLQPSVAF